MKVIRFKILKSYNSIITLLLSFLGFASSCDIWGGRAMYGTPSADFIVKGKVESAGERRPIAGIKVELSKEVDTENGKIPVDIDHSVSAETTGAYTVANNGGFPIDQTYKVKFTDIDGALNGEFETLDTTIIFQNPKYTGGDGSWYNGRTEKELNVKMKTKK
jgi:putative lipoprotein (rSAM/lipoprotein system)